MPKTGKKELTTEGTAAREEVETQLGATSYNKTPEPAAHLEVTEEEGKHQEDTANHMERMEGHRKDKGSQEEVKEGQTSTPIAK